ncbi:MAG TPA: YIP1 family protein [Vicinamibacterales bacterium]|nr:YIP1 family protein [Vicinamibacterales bacterium]
MTSSTVEAGSSPARPGVFARFVGVVFSPRPTFEQVAAQPRWLGMALLVGIAGAVLIGGFLLTEIGQQAWLDQTVTQTEAMGRTMSDQQYAAMERMAPIAGYLAMAQMIIGIPVVLFLVSGVLFAVFNAVMGGSATFKQLYSVVIHSTAVWVVGWVFVTPLNYARGSMSSPTNLAVLAPMLDERSFVTRLLGSVDLFMVWWTIVLAIGVAVLYRRRTQPILITFLGIYALIAIGIAAFMASRAGS